MNKEITNVERAWVAGFFDGEGSITTPRTMNGIPQIRVTNTNLNVLKFIQERWGGEIITRGLDEQKRPRQKKIVYQLHFYPPEKARRLLEDLAPYLQLKKLQAELVLYWLDEVKKFTGLRAKMGSRMLGIERSWREEMVEQLRKLNTGEQTEFDLITSNILRERLL